MLTELATWSAAQSTPSCRAGQRASPLQPRSTGSARGTSSEGFLLGLVVARRISTVTLLEALVYPVIHHVATVAMASKSRVSNAHQLAVGSAVTYLQQLLLSTPLNPSLPPMTLQEAFIVQTSRTRVLDNAHVPDLIKHLPLLVLISASKGVTASLTEDIHKFLQSFAMTPEFKTACVPPPRLAQGRLLVEPLEQTRAEPCGRGRHGGDIEAGHVGRR